MKLEYKTEDNICTTKCEFIEEKGFRIGSEFCVNHCENFVSIDRENNNVECEKE